MNGKTKSIMVLILIGFLLFTTIFISGCAQTSGSNVKSNEDVGRTVENMSTGINDLSTILGDIDKALG